MCCSTLFKVLEWFWIETPMVSVQQPCRSRTATAAVAEEKRTEVSVRRAGSDNVQLSQKHSEWNIHINPPCPLDFQQNLQVQMEGKSASPEKFQVQKPTFLRVFRFSPLSIFPSIHQAATPTWFPWPPLRQRWHRNKVVALWLILPGQTGQIFKWWPLCIVVALWSHEILAATWSNWDIEKESLSSLQLTRLSWCKKKCRFSGWNWACCGEGIL